MVVPVVKRTGIAHEGPRRQAEEGRHRDRPGQPRPTRRPDRHAEVIGLHDWIRAVANRERLIGRGPSPAFDFTIAVEVYRGDRGLDAV